MTIPAIWQLAKAWYHNRLSTDYRGRNHVEVQQIFKQQALTSGFWASDDPENSPQK